MPISMPGGPRASFPGSASSTYGHAGHGLLAQSLHTHSLHSHSLHSHSGASSNDMLYGGMLQPSCSSCSVVVWQSGLLPFSFESGLSAFVRP